jgi:nucleoid-associated protein YgaU
MLGAQTPYERYGRPSPATDASLREYVFRATDSLSNLAQRFYGDWRLWRLIADRNNIVDVRNIAPGTQLLIPRKPLQSGRYESL